MSWVKVVRGLLPLVAARQFPALAYLVFACFSALGVGITVGIFSAPGPRAEKPPSRQFTRGG